MSDQTKQLYFLCGILVGAVAAFAVERTIPIRVKIDPITVKPAVVEVKQKMATTNIGPCACCGGGGPITTTCCAEAIPRTLTVTLYNDSFCPCLHLQTIEITYDEGLGYWTGSSSFTCEQDSGTVMYSLRCNDGAWEVKLTSTCADSGDQWQAPASVTCSPFMAEVAQSGDIGTCLSEDGVNLCNVTSIITE